MNEFKFPHITLLLLSFSEVVFQEEFACQFSVICSHLFLTFFQLGSYDLLLLESFISDVLDAIRKMPIQMYQRTAYNKNEIFVDLVDHCVVVVRSFEKKIASE